MTFDLVKRRGLMLILSSPSGAGKTSIARALLSQDSYISISISATTRQKRPSEVNGQDYHFMDEQAFLAETESDKFLEWATVFGHYYGTPREPVDHALAQGRDVLFDIDWQGAQQLKEKAPKDVVLVFILPPTGDALHARLQTRAEDPEEVIRQRMAAAASELSHWPEYDYIVINHELPASVNAVQSILNAERMKRERLTGLSRFTRDLVAKLK